MRPARSLLPILLLTFAPAATASAQTPTRLDTLVQTTSHRLDVEDGGLSGPGAEWITTRARESQHVLMGEEHGSAGIARFAKGLFAALAREGYRYAAVEVDPLIAADLDRLLRDDDPGALKAYLQQEGYAMAVPFFSWTEEADFLRAAVRLGSATEAVWGLDQAFIGAAYVWLKEIESGARTPKARTHAARLAAAAKANLMSFLGTIDPAELEALRDELDDPGETRARGLAAQMAQSARIYGPFVRGGGSVYAANLERETLMKQRFTEYAQAAETRDGAPPRVMFKFGANHMTLGLSSTHVPSLASFVSETSEATGRKVLRLLVVCGPGSAVSDFMGETYATDDDFAKHYGFLGAHVAGPGCTLIDLAPWKDRPRVWKDIPAETAALIWAYDALVVVSGAGPATFVVPR